jgi:hypothetical protein
VPLRTARPRARPLEQLGGNGQGWLDRRLYRNRCFREATEFVRAGTIPKKLAESLPPLRLFKDVPPEFGEGSYESLRIFYIEAPRACICPEPNPYFRFDAVTAGLYSSLSGMGILTSDVKQQLNGEDEETAHLRQGADTVLAIYCSLQSRAQTIKTLLGEL